MSHSSVKLPACANCGYVFPAGEPDEFCPQCGQQNHELNLSFGHVLEETLEGVFHFDSKVFRTLRLLFRPGQLTQRFVEGHRIDYVPPIRLYVFISFVFFLLLSLTSGDSEKKAGSNFFKKDFITVTDPKQEERELEKADSLAQATQRKVGWRASTAPIRVPKLRRDTTNILDMAFRKADLQWYMEHETEARTDSMIRVSGHQPTWFRRVLLKRMTRILDASQAEIKHKLQKNISVAMFLLMPLFALLLQGLYVRHRRFYISHLILAVHFHCFVFLLFIAYLLLGYLPLPDDWLVLALLILPAWYLYKALRYTYQQPRLRTLTKVLLMMAGYGLTLVLVLMGALVVSLLLV